jgi:hypothetical protein
MGWAFITGRREGAFELFPRVPLIKGLLGLLPHMNTDRDPGVDGRHFQQEETM